MDEYTRQTKDEYEMKSALQDESMQGQATLNSPYLRENAMAMQAAIIEQTNPKNVIKEIELVLKGEMEDPKTGNIVKKGEPLLNDYGINKLLTFCRGIINQNTTISCLEKVEIRQLMEALSEDLVDDLALNWKRYEIREKTNLDIINDVVLSMMFMALNRSLMGGERNFLKTSTMEVLNQRQGFAPEKPKSFLSHFRIGG